LLVFLEIFSAVKVKFIWKRIYGKKIKVGRNGEKWEQYFLLPMREMGVQTQNGGPQF
jgi:hypothetical protein